MHYSPPAAEDILDFNRAFGHRRSLVKKRTVSVQDIGEPIDCEHVIHIGLQSFLKNAGVTAMLVSLTYTIIKIK